MKRRMLLAKCEGVVPIVGQWSQTLYDRMQGDHLDGGEFTRVVGVEAAADVVPTSDQAAEPGRVGSRAGGRDADAFLMHLKAADRVDGRFA